MLGRGLRYLGLEVSQRMADSLTRETLTARESEVLRLLAAGLCNKSIASRLLIGVGTVKAHVRGIMGKLGASSRTQVVTIAAQRGLVDEPPLSLPVPAREEPPQWSVAARRSVMSAGTHACDQSRRVGPVPGAARRRSQVGLPCDSSSHSPGSTRS